ncbi:hypothetical protein V8C26DRAFT_212649 [Trichoderma gracile]
MEAESPRLPSETTHFLGCPRHPPWKKTVFDPYEYASHRYHKGFDETSIWIDIECKSRSVRYHLSDCIKYQNGPEIAASSDDRPFRSHTGSILRYSTYNGPLSRNAWRVKIASDMARSGIDVLQDALEALQFWINDRESVDVAYTFGKWLCLMCASYAIRALHYSPVLDTAAHTALLLSGCLVLRSTCQLLYIGIRSVFVSRCQSIVSSLSFRMVEGDVHQHDVDSLNGFWFRGLTFFRDDERLGIYVEKSFVPPRECLVEIPLPASEYVIPEDE